MTVLETIRKSAEVRLLDGQSLEGAFFLERATPAGAGPQSLLELLNSPRRFLPFEIRPGEVLLLGKQGIAYAVSEPATGGPCPSCSRSFDAAVVMVTGQTLLGTIVQDLPDHFPRLSDFLNFSPGFFALRVGMKDWYLSTAAICHVRHAQDGK
jgi:hypothetical protein